MFDYVSYIVCAVIANLVSFGVICCVVKLAAWWGGR